VFVISS